MQHVTLLSFIVYAGKWNLEASALGQSTHEEDMWPLEFRVVFDSKMEALEAHSDTLLDSAYGTCRLHKVF